MIAPPSSLVSGIVDYASDLSGVYGCFSSTWDGFILNTRLPEDHSGDIAQNITDQGVELFNQASGQLEECTDLQIDYQDYSVLIFGGEQVYLFLLVNDSKRIPKIKEVIKALPIERWEDELIEESRYTDEVEIGEGGTAFVFRAYDSRLRRNVALKRFKDQENVLKNDDYLSELESASRVQCENVVKIYDADSDQRGRFLVMGLIEGKNLEDLAKAKPCTLKQVINLASQTLEALVATHGGGLLHLDIKPANIMITETVGERNHVTLIDYGMAQLRTGEHGDPPKGGGLKGSIFFTSPEYLMGQALDHRADLYSLGCVFYFALTGETPFDGAGAVQVMAAHLQHQVDDLTKTHPDTPGWLTQLIMDCIEQYPKDRPQDAAEALRRLEDGRRSSGI